MKPCFASVALLVKSVQLTVWLLPEIMDAGLELGFQSSMLWERLFHGRGGFLGGAALPGGGEGGGGREGGREGGRGEGGGGKR